MVSTIGGGIGGGFSLGGFLFEPGSNSFGGRFCKEKRENSLKCLYFEVINCLLMSFLLVIKDIKLNFL